MTWHTHLLFGLVFSSVLLVLTGIEVSFTLTALAALGSLAPDIDASESKIKHLGIPVGKHRRAVIKPFFLPGIILNRLFGHRRFLHSLTFLALIFIAGTLVQVAVGSKIPFTIAFCLGYLSHLIADSITPAGLPLFYPVQRTIWLVPRSLTVRTGSGIDLLLTVIFALLLIGLVFQYPALITLK